MTLREIKALLELARAHDLVELEVEREGSRLRIRRSAGEVPPTPAATAAAPAGGEPAQLPASASGSRLGLLTIEAPMVGTFYRSPSPETPPFVKEGDAVKKGQVVGIVEAMKLMNEIEAKVSGRIVKVLVENAQPVEFGQPLFLVEP